MINIPYTYLIGWSKHNIWYYGVRYSKKCNLNELWKTYFTSSKYVKDFRFKFGEPDVIEVRKIFSSIEKATLWEEKVIRRMRCVKKDNWLNRGNAKKEFYNIKHTDLTKNKIKNKALGRKDSIETRMKKSESRKKWKHNRISIDKWVDKQSKIYNFINPEGFKITVKNLNKFCRDNKLSSSAMRGVYFGKRKTHKEYRRLST